MLNARLAAVTAGLLALLVTAPGCLVRRRVIASPGSPRGKPRTLLTASRDELVRRIRSQYDAIHTFNATVDMTPATGSVYKGEITEYKDIRAYVIYRKPSEIRLIGLAPVVRTKVFDMVSNGEKFQILIPPKNRFIEGRNDAPPSSKNSLENLRPEAFLQAMLIPPPDPARETPVLLDSTDEETALYVLLCVGKTPSGELMVNRTLFFDRTTLALVRQKEHDAEGTTLSDTRYNDWKVNSGVLFPTSIDINRPKDGYGVVMTIVKLNMNDKGITDDKFILQRPEGTQLQVIGAAAAPEAPVK